MRLNVKPILYTPGSRLPFSFALDLRDLEFNGRNPIVEPVQVDGQVTNTAGLLELSLTAQTTLDAMCDRCMKRFPQKKTVEYQCLLAETVENEDSEIVLLEDGEVDVGDLARTAFILGMDTRTLCSEDCKGLCPRCGADLNLGPCGCRREVDPRLAVLGRLLETPDAPDA